MEIEANPAPVAPPRGTFPARLDDKGRLKLPVAFQEFLGKEKLFVTSLDGRIARIYPISVWLANEKLLYAQTDDPDIAERVTFLANKYGADSEVDGQGRVLMPTDLRRRLEMENQTVWLMHFKGGVNVYNKAVYDEEDRRAAENPDDLKKLRQKGFL